MGALRARIGVVKGRVCKGGEGREGGAIEGKGSEDQNRD